MDWARLSCATGKGCVDSRTWLVIGGMTTVAASIAVVCAVAMTTSSALVDAAGATVAARPVVVPTSAASPTPVARPTALPVTPPPAASVPVLPETVPAPAPEDIAAPSSGQAPVSEPSARTEDELAAAVAASGSWDVVYAWAQQRGWSQARTEAWIARLGTKISDDRAGLEPGPPADRDADRLVVPDPITADRMAPLVPAEGQTISSAADEPPAHAERVPAQADERPAEAEKASERDHSGPPFGSKRERSQVPPD